MTLLVLSLLQLTGNKFYLALSWFQMILLFAQDSRRLNSSVGKALDKCLTKGVNVVMAAGNQQQDACDSHDMRNTGVIVVGAMDRSDNIAEFSNFGKCVTLYAPGVDIPSPKADPEHNRSHCLTKKSGTSMAAAHVAGAIAMYMSSQIEAPSVHEITQWLDKNTSPKETTPPSKDSWRTVQRLNIRGTRNSTA